MHTLIFSKKISISKVLAYFLYNYYEVRISKKSIRTYKPYRSITCYAQITKRFIAQSIQSKLPKRKDQNFNISTKLKEEWFKRETESRKTKL